MAQNTPNPHRFLTPKSSRPSASASSTRPGPPLPPIPSSQFTPAPRFDVSSKTRSSDLDAAQGFQPSSPLNRNVRIQTSRPIPGVDDIEESNTFPKDSDTHSDPTNDIPEASRSIKRRRYNDTSLDEPIAISSSPTVSPPITPPPHCSTSLHSSPAFSPPPQRAQLHQQLSPRPRNTPFVIPTSPPVNTTPNSNNKSTTTIPSRPPFLLPPRSPTSPPPPPSPSAFYTPHHHRRSQKYVTGGLASTVRDWVVETAERGRWHGGDSGGSRYKENWRERGAERERGWDFRLRVAEMVCSSTGASSGGGGGAAGKMVVVRGVEVAGLPPQRAEGSRRGGAKGWILVGRGASGGEMVAEGEVEVGKAIGVREPIWEVDGVRGETWHVGIDWGVLP